MRKFFLRTIAALLIVTGLFTTALVGAAVQTFDGQGQWQMIEELDDDAMQLIAMERALQDAQYNARQKVIEQLKNLSARKKFPSVPKSLLSFTPRQSRRKSTPMTLPNSSNATTRKKLQSLRNTSAPQLKANLAEAYQLRGMIYQQLGNTAKAQADFARAKELGYSG